MYIKPPTCVLVIKLRDSLLFVLQAEGTSGDERLLLSVCDTGRTELSSSAETK